MRNKLYQAIILIIGFGIILTTWISFSSNDNGKEHTPEAKVKRTQELTIQMVDIPAGCYQMGSNSGSRDELPVHKVCLDAYAIGKYEVTQGQWNAVMGSNPSRFHSCGDDCPVETVNWNDIQGFIKKLNAKTSQNFRLPTEAEWEYACRSGGKDQIYCGGDQLASLSWSDENSSGKTHAVGQKQANGLGIHDMSGNVWEWIQDWHNDYYYKHSPVNNPTGPTNGSIHGFRGGAWGYGAKSCRSTNRYGFDPGFRSYDLGFRLAKNSGHPSSVLIRSMR